MSLCSIKMKTTETEVENMKILKTIGYRIGKKIGEGTYSRVCIALHSKNGRHKKVACKIINKKRAEVEFIKHFLPREIRIVSKIRHPNIVSVSNIFEINNFIYIFMDYCIHGDLLDYILKYGALSRNQAKRYFRQIADAVRYLHDKNIAHRDLKCENILFAPKCQIKLGDFGFARSCVDKKTGNSVLSSTYCGSAAYAAPEILQGIPYDPKMYDIWSMGCVLFVMLSASMPFDDTNLKKMLKSQLEKNELFLPRVWKKECPDLMTLLSNLLEPDVTKRYTITEVVNCPWLNEIFSISQRTMSMLSLENAKKAKFGK
ncbi:hypothetical protein FQA39_LY17238 [Lamprigera yunnana]|nr:hypothetical protein FQA39_LY17238 [Lamprigera yunnana]